MVPAPTIQSLLTQDGLTLHTQSWRPPHRPPRALLVIVHGVGEHCDRYSHVIDHLLPLGIEIHSWDHRGHGRSSGHRGHVNRWSDYADDLRAIVAHSKANHAHDLPLYLFGHSMGALVTLDVALSGNLPIAGLIISGVPVQPSGVAKPHLIALSHLLSHIWPTFSVRLPFDGKDLTADTTELDKILRDTNGHRQITVRWGREALRAIQRLRTEASSRLTHPLLILHGALDTVNLAAGAQWLHDHAATTDKTFHLYPSTHHEPHNDIERAAALEDLSTWILRRLPTSSPPL